MIFDNEKVPESLNLTVSPSANLNRVISDAAKLASAAGVQFITVPHIVKSIIDLKELSYAGFILNSYITDISIEATQGHTQSPLSLLFREAHPLHCRRCDKSQ